MQRERFEALVESAISDLPDFFQEKLENIVIVVEDRPSSEIAGNDSDHLILGLYEGIAQPERSVWDHSLLPDKITIFQKNIEQVCHSESEMVEEIRKTVMHEIGHYFGFNEAELDDMGL